MEIPSISSADGDFFERKKGEADFEFSYEENYQAISNQYRNLPEEGKVAFLAEKSQFIEINKSANNDRLLGQVKAYQDFLSDLMSERE